MKPSVKRNHHYPRTPPLSLIPLLFVALCAVFPAALSASDWTGGGGNWSSDLIPGWNGTGVPNSVGAIANFGAAATGFAGVTQDIDGGVTVGTISFSVGNAAVSRTINLSSTNGRGLTLDQDGAGSGFATISNTNTNASASNSLQIGGGTVTLADNVLISNTGNSTATAGAVILNTLIAGSGNLTFSNVSTDLTRASSIYIQNNSNFLGSVLVRQGTVVFGSNTPFGNSANVITLGQAGAGDAALLNATNSTLPNNITVASGTGGTSTLGSIYTLNPNPIYTGTITLNGDVTLLGANVGNGSAGTQFKGSITGSGSVTANAADGASAVVISLEGDNDFTGTTTINNNVTLRAAAAGVNQSLGGTSGVTVNSGGTLLLSSSNQINNSGTLTLNGGTFNANGRSEGTAAALGAGIGALTLMANSTIDFGTATSILHFAGLGAHTPGPGADLAILSWTGGMDRLLFTGLASEFMLLYDQSDVSFNGGTGYSLVQFSGFYELTPVPEPGTWAAGVLVVVTLGFSRRKRLRKLVFSTRPRRGKRIRSV